MDLDNRNAIVISDATSGDFPDIISIAYATWPTTYGAILSAEQLDYMLGLFYTIEALDANASNGQHFLIAKLGSSAVGFAAYEDNYSDRRATHIHKLYVLPGLQGKGVGSMLVDFIEMRARSATSRYLSLNVNRSNDAKSFYEKMGFSVHKEVDIALDHGYMMEDYIMRKPLT